MSEQAARGALAYYSGLSAEEQVARDYLHRGMRLVAQRWRGKAGEIDLIFQRGAEFIFVEVKRAKTIANAALRISAKQQERICLAAQEFLGTQPGGLLSDMRIDAAFVDGQGHLVVLENAIEEA